MSTAAKKVNPVKKAGASLADNETRGLSAAASLPDRRPAATVQRQLQANIAGSLRLQQATNLQRAIDSSSRQQAASAPLQKKENKTGLPDHLKAGIENLSGHSLDDVQVHYNSAKPAQLQAHAYAQGTNIHLGPGQEKYLPHEAWHVVQQKQGRVRPTMQLKGLGINDNKFLEDEAVSMGQQAPLSSLVDSKVKLLKEGLATAPVVQRAVGFEFETGWKVWGWDPDKEEVLRQAGQKRPPVIKPLKKKDLVHEGNGFKVEADEAGGGEAELEFIVHPPIPATNAGLASSLERMTDVYLYGAKLLSRLPRKLPLDKATGNAADRKFIVEPADKVLGARPQVTAGISLENIPKLSKPHGGVSLPSQLRKTSQTAESVAVDVKEDKVKDLLPEEFKLNQKLMGLLMPISMYIQNGAKAVYYPKQVADNFLLARTDFAGLFRLLSSEMQDYFRKNPKKFVEVGLAAAGVERGDEPVIGRVWKTEGKPEDGVYAVGPSREQWLFFITQGYDLLSGSHYKDMMDKAQQQEGSPITDLESLGELGRKTEPTRGNDKEGGIFELRSAALEGRHGIIPMLGWLPFVRQTLAYFIHLGESE